MEQPKFDYRQEPIGAQKIIYDLALTYAKAKFNHALQTGKDFDNGVVDIEINEIEYLRSQFEYALFCLTGTEPGDMERAFTAFDKGERPFMG